jgi:hypothetical protein
MRLALAGRSVRPQIPVPGFRRLAEEANVSGRPPARLTVGDIGVMITVAVVAAVAGVLVQYLVLGVVNGPLAGGAAAALAGVIGLRRLRRRGQGRA